MGIYVDETSKIGKVGLGPPFVRIRVGDWVDGSGVRNRNTMQYSKAICDYALGS